MVEFKDRIKEIRLKLNMSQKEFGDFLDKSSSTIGMYEIGKREPACCKDFIFIAERIGCTLDYLMGRTNDFKGYSENFSAEMKKVIIEDFLKTSISKYLSKNP